MFDVIDTFLKNLNLPEFQSDMLASLIFCIIVYTSVLIIGFSIDKFETVLIKILSRKVGFNKAVIICSRCTFPGVVIHELSHALLVIMSGAKVTKMMLFNPFASKTLGYVNFATKGGKIKSKIQMALSSCAPVIIGFFLVYFIFKAAMLPNLTIIMRIIFWYFIISIVLHMSMSKQDIKNYLKGQIALFPITWVLVLFIKYMLM